MSVFGQALVLEWAELGDKITEKDFHVLRFTPLSPDWYITHRFPRHRSLPGLYGFSQWNKADTGTPSWVAFYDISHGELLQDPNSYWHTIVRHPSPLDQSVFKRLVSFERMHYIHVGAEATQTQALVAEVLSAAPSVASTSYTNPSTPTIIASTITPAPVVPSKKFIFIVRIEVPPSLNKEFNSWCDTEHMPMVQKFPGWTNNRRYRRIDNYPSLGNNAPIATQVNPRAAGGGGVGMAQNTEYLIIHELDPIGLAELSNYWEDKSTWRKEIMARIVRKDVRLFEGYFPV